MTPYVDSRDGRSLSIYGSECQIWKTLTRDEAYSTFEAKQMLYDELHVSAAKLWDVQDQLAAQLILQSWLNEQ